MKPTTFVSALGLGLLAFTGCASSDYGRSTLPALPHSTPAIDLVLEDTGARPSAPARLSVASTPAAVRRLNGQVLAQLGGRARTDLRLCIGSDGAVTDVSLVHGSGIDALDAAMIDLARAWRYQAVPVAKVCQAVSIGYTVR
ncbi:MAG TPA: TonB family protein [Kofleriaceae bacterium]|nr:TonB family protein [Kofleriaceae bacterium]